MPFFTADHISRALSYFPEHSHPSLISLLAMMKSGVPLSATPSKAFGSAQENKLMRAYFRPEGGPPDRPWYVPFGTRKEDLTDWKPRFYAGTSLQRMRTGKPWIYKQGTGASSDLWSLDPDLAIALRERHEVVIGRTVPISVHNLAVWCYRTLDFSNQQAAIDRFVEEFGLTGYNVLGFGFDASPDPALIAIPLATRPLSASEIFALLQPPPGPAIAVGTAALAATTQIAEAVLEDVDEEAEKVPAITWEVEREDVRAALEGLRSMEESAFRAIAALRAGMHVIFTGPPGTGKTQLARRLCQATGIPFFMVAATDQWTTIDTIGGYFPSATGSGQLDFQPGFVVNAMAQERVLIIDEINRADIDKAFGELFTLLSGNDVDLPYVKQDANEPEAAPRRIRLVMGDAPAASDVETIRVPPWWRLIGSMNDADKASLKRLSYAFIRRFAFIPVEIPQPAVYRELLDAGAGTGSDGLAATRSDYLDALKALFAEPTGLASIDMAMGFAIPEAMMRHARSEIALDPARTTAALLTSTLDLYVAPQFQGRADRHDELLNLVAGYFGADERKEFGRRLAVGTGYIE
jgi:5-methylcytosine-specific restriction enzyme B